MALNICFIYVIKSCDLNLLEWTLILQIKNCSKITVNTARLHFAVTM